MVKTAVSEIDKLLEEAWAFNMQDPDQCRLMSLKAKTLCEASGHIPGLLTAWRNLCELHIRFHEYEAALTLLNQALTYLEKPEYSLHPAAFDLYLQASAVHTRLGNSPKSITYCYQAEGIALKENDLLRQAHVYKTIGNTHVISGEYRKALVNYEKALTLFFDLDDKTGKVTILNNMCHTFHQSGDYEDSLRMGLEGLELYETQDQTDNVPQRVYAYNLNNVGLAYLKQGNFATAVGYFEKSTNIFRQERDIYGEIYSLRGLAQVNMHRQQHEKAFAQFYHALALAEQSEIAAELVQCHLALANAYKESNDFQQALFHFEKYHKYEKNIRNDETERKIRDLESTYKIQKARQEAELYQLKNDALQKEIKKRREAEAVAEAAAKAKSDFLANMSHEIRTPLNGIIGVVELMQNTPLNVQQQELVQIIQKSGDNLLRIVNDVLDFSKIEAGKLELEQVPFSVRQAVETAVDLLTPRAQEKQLDIGYMLEPDVPEFIVGDSTRFQQILINLLGNGIKFTDKGSVSVQVTSRQAGDKVEIQTAVKDTGIGIGLMEQRHLFQSFSQVDSSMTRKYGGTGLGLAISRLLAELMGGRMWVKSKPDHGSTFHFTIQAPVALSHEPQQTGNHQAETTQPANGSTGLLMAHQHPLTILIAEDNKVNQKVAKKILSRLGYEAELANNGAEAVRRLTERPFDVIFMDIQMPEMDGVTATQEIIKQYAGQTRPYIFAMTAHALKGDREKLLEAGMDDYISKPIRLESLTEALQNYIYKKKS